MMVPVILKQIVSVGNHSPVAVVWSTVNQMGRRFMMYCWRGYIHAPYNRNKSELYGT